MRISDSVLAFYTALITKAVFPSEVVWDLTLHRQYYYSTVNVMGLYQKATPAPYILQKEIHLQWRIYLFRKVNATVNHLFAKILFMVNHSRTSAHRFVILHTRLTAENALCRCNLFMNM